MADIFISYARADRDTIQALAGRLEKAGLSVWWDHHIRGGAEYSKDIERELAAARHVIVAWSQEATQSRWVKDEAGVAAEAEKLIAVSLDGSEPPLGFRQFHAIDYTDKNAGFTEIMRAIDGAADATDAVRFSAYAAPAEASTPFYQNRVIWGLGAVAALGLVLTALVLGGGDEALDQTAQTAGPDGVGRTSPAVEVATAPAPEKSIAVLPFVDMSEAGDQAYFSDGVAEEILNALVKLDGLQVAGRTSSFAFKGRNADMREIGRALGVKHILEGSVRKQGMRVRITAQLIRAEDGFHLWSEVFDGTLDDIFDLQETISRAIADELKVILIGDQARRLADTLTDNQQAYDLFLQGRDLVARLWGDETMPRAVALLERAAAIDPDFAQAWALLGRANYLLPQYTVVNDEEPYLAAAERAGQRALALDPTLAHAHMLLGNLRVVRQDYAGARAHFDRALQIAPNDGVVLFAIAHNRMVIGQTSQAARLCKKSMALNPLVGSMTLGCAVVELSRGDLAEAERLARHSVDLDFTGGVFTVADILQAQDKSDDGMAFIAENASALQGYASQFASPEVWDLGLKAMYQRDPQARAAIGQFLEAYLQSESPRVNTPILSMLHMMGEPERFMAVFESHQFANSGFVLSRIWDDRPESRAIREHPDFPAFAKRIGLVEVWRSAGWPDKCQPLDAEASAFECA